MPAGTPVFEASGKVDGVLVTDGVGLALGLALGLGLGLGLTLGLALGDDVGVGCTCCL